VLYICIVKQSQTLKQIIMGTRSTYRIIEQYTDDNNNVKNQDLVLVYRQYDGYPEGHPIDTARWLESGKLVNGIGANETQLVFNGAGCLAAQLIAKFKDGAGGTYIHPMSHRGKCWEDYLYDIIIKTDNTIEYVCYENYGKRPKELFRGTPEQFIEKYQVTAEV
jgi:hypothetical protein